MLKSRTIIVGLLVGTLVTLVASLAPARRATRVPPLAAMRDEAAVPPPPTRRRKILSWGLLIIGALAILFALFGGAPASQALSMLGVGAIALFIAVALLSPRLVPVIAGAVGRPARAIARRGRPACARERDAQPEPHGRDGGRADDRARARDLRLHPRGRRQGVDRRHGGEPDEGGARRAQQRTASSRPSAPSRRTAIRRVPGVEVVSPAEVLSGEGRGRRRQAVRERDRSAHVRPRLGHGHRRGTGEPLLGSAPEIRWRWRRTSRTPTTSTSATGWR